MMDIILLFSFLESHLSSTTRDPKQDRNAAPFAPRLSYHKMQNTWQALHASINVGVVVLIDGALESHRALFVAQAAQ
jgi:hypothetical protein